MVDNQEVAVREPVELRGTAAPDDDRTSLALAGGLIAAVVGGLIWAAIVLIAQIATWAGSAGAITEEMLRDPESLQGAVAWQLYDAEELEPATQQEVEATLEAGGTLSNAVLGGDAAPRGRSPVRRRPNGGSRPRASPVGLESWREC